MTLRTPGQVKMARDEKLGEAIVVWKRIASALENLMVIGASRDGLDVLFRRCPKCSCLNTVFDGSQLKCCTACGEVFGERAEGKVEKPE